MNIVGFVYFPVSSNLITKRGFDSLDLEIRRIEEVDRPDIISKVSEAREKGDLSENAEYHSARERQRLIESRLKYLHDTRSSSQVMDISLISNTNIIYFGAKVILEAYDGTKRSLTIVSEYESDPNNGLISVNTPVAASILKKTIGDVVKIMTNGVAKEFEIMEISYDYI